MAEVLFARYASAEPAQEAGPPVVGLACVEGEEPRNCTSLTWGNPQQGRLAVGEQEVDTQW
eukprot:12168741-Alexandrium_andersonii.AAC.1